MRRGRLAAGAGGSGATRRARPAAAPSPATARANHRPSLRRRPLRSSWVPETSPGARSAFTTRRPPTFSTASRGRSSRWVTTCRDPVRPRTSATAYEPSWGRHKARTWPAVGNHEYNVPGAVPHYEYWGDRAGPAGKGYYSLRPGGVAHRGVEQQHPLRRAERVAGGRSGRESGAMHARLLASPVVHVERVSRVGGAASLRRDPP